MTSLATLESHLRATIEGEVRFDVGTRAAYATDASNYRQVPVGVVIPRHEGDVIAALSLARENAMPILARGGGTSLAGQGCNAALVLDFSKYMNRIIAIDPGARISRSSPVSCRAISMPRWRRTACSSRRIRRLKIDAPLAG